MYYEWGPWGAGPYIGTQTLTKDKSPYIIHASCRAGGFLRPGSTLTIEPGVIVKFETPQICFGGTSWWTSYGNIEVAGRLIVNGTPEEPVIFTSMRDDVGEDSNNDGNTTSPQQGDWKSIQIAPYASAVIKNAVIRYGGSNINGSLSISSLTTTTTLENLEISNSIGYGLYSGIPVSVRNSRFFENGLGSISTISTVDAINSWWGDDSGPRVASNPNGTGETFEGNVLYDPWVGKRPYNKAPVLRFTENDSDGVEPKVNYLPYQPKFEISYLDVDSDDPQYINVIINGAVFSFATSSGVNFASGTLYSFTPPTGTLQKGEYEFYFETSDGKEVVRFPQTGELSFKVQNTPVIVVPGIMGSEFTYNGWVLDPILHVYDDLLASFEANGYERGKDLFAFPYQWRQSNYFSAIQLKQKINYVKSICNCKKVDLVAHSMGGLVSRQYVQSDDYEDDVDQLLFMGTPHFGAPKDYLAWEAGEMGLRIDDKVLKLMLDGERREAGYDSVFSYIHYKPIPSVQQLLPIYDYLIDKGSVLYRIYPENYPRNIFLEVLNQGINKLLESRIKITNIIGDDKENSTISSIRLTENPFGLFWPHGYPDGYDGSSSDFGLVLGMGDGTVPLRSSNLSIFETIVVSSSHTGLPTKAAGFAINKITGKANPTVIDKFRFLNLKIILIKILSPADFVVIAPDGKRVGKNFANGESLNEIEGAFYSGFKTENEFITISNPLDGEYKIETIGTGNGGKYTLVVDYINENTSIQDEFIGNILPSQITSVKFEINSENLSIFDIKPVDEIPPEIILNSPLSWDYTRSDVIEINAHSFDSGTGLFSQDLYLDGIMIQNETLFDLFYFPLGNHYISIKSSDFVGNISLSSSSFRIVSTPSSIISDIKRAYSLGWISDEDIVESLISKINKSIRWDVVGNYFKIDKVLGKEFIKYLKNHLGKSINQKAYNLLIEDINWLVAN